MTIKNLYISHQNYDWAKVSAEHHTMLLTEKKLQKAIESADENNYHTSLEDLGSKLYNLVDLLESTNSTIVLIDLDQNFVNVINDTSLYLYLNFFKELVKLDSRRVVNFEWYNKLNKELFVNLVAQRKTKNKNLWAVGCSITHGDGVKDDEKYPVLLEKMLGLPVTVLSSSGSSIAWQADQILQSDIARDDIIVWGLTSFNRIDIAEGYNLQPYSITDYVKYIPSTKQYWKIDYFNSLTQSVPCIKNILQVINFCKKVGAKLYLINLLETTWVNFIFKNEKNYLDLTKPFNSNNLHEFLDFGADNEHPGPKQHQEYAVNIFNFIKENHHGN